jgi:Uma2 family endonuclease
VDWKQYSKLLTVFEGQPGHRLAYDHGELEIMSPLFVHDRDNRFLARLVTILTEELHLPLVDGGSTTMKRALLQRGIEADTCFWIANAHRMQGHQRLDLRRDPPPDLAIEVDVTSSSLDRLGIYAALKVPELWQLEGDELTFYALGDNNNYDIAAQSQSFPGLTPFDLMRFVKRARRHPTDQNPVARAFRTWVRQHMAK